MGSGRSAVAYAAFLRWGLVSERVSKERGVGCSTACSTSPSNGQIAEREGEREKEAGRGP